MIDYQDQDQEFEYNDGLGDLLREKERREFSWLKTTIVFLVVIVVTILIVKGLFHLGRPFFSGTSQEAISYDDQSTVADANEIDQECAPDVVSSDTPEKTISNPPLQKTTPEPVVQTRIKEPAAPPAIANQKVYYKVITGYREYVVYKASP